MANRHFWMKGILAAFDEQALRGVQETLLGREPVAGVLYHVASLFIQVD